MIIIEISNLTINRQKIRNYINKNDIKKIRYEVEFFKFKSIKIKGKRFDYYGYKMFYDKKSNANNTYIDKRKVISLTNYSTLVLDNKD